MLTCATRLNHFIHIKRRHSHAKNNDKFLFSFCRFKKRKENMIGPTSFIDEIDCGSFFDHIDDLLDFPNVDVEAGLSPSDSAINAADFPSIWTTTHPESLPCSDSVFSNNSASDLSAELSVPVSVPCFFLIYIMMTS